MLAQPQGTSKGEHHGGTCVYRARTFLAHLLQAIVELFAPILQILGSRVADGAWLENHPLFYGGFRMFVWHSCTNGFYSNEALS
jgi:hypothetical protein